MTHSYHNTLIDPIPRSQNNTTQMKTQGEERVWFNLSLPLVAGHLWQSVLGGARAWVIRPGYTLG